MRFLSILLLPSALSFPNIFQLPTALSSALDLVPSPAQQLWSSASIHPPSVLCFLLFLPCPAPCFLPTFHKLGSPTRCVVPVPAPPPHRNTKKHPRATPPDPTAVNTVHKRSAHKSHRQRKPRARFARVPSSAGSEGIRGACSPRMCGRGRCVSAGGARRGPRPPGNG